MFDSLGFNYLKMSFFGGLLGFSFSLVLGGYFYNICLTSHGLMTVLFFLIFTMEGINCYMFLMILKKVNTLKAYNFPTINNLNIWWNVEFLILIFIGMQMITSILPMLLTNSVEGLIFKSYVFKEISLGWALINLQVVFPLSMECCFMLNPYSGEMEFLLLFIKFLLMAFMTPMMGLLFMFLMEKPYTNFKSFLNNLSTKTISNLLNFKNSVESDFSLNASIFNHSYEEVKELKLTLDFSVWNTTDKFMIDSTSQLENVFANLHCLLHMVGKFLTAVFILYVMIKLLYLLFFATMSNEALSAYYPPLDMFDDVLSKYQKNMPHKTDYLYQEFLKGTCMKSDFNNDWISYHMSFFWSIVFCFVVVLLLPLFTLFLIIFLSEEYGISHPTMVIFKKLCKKLYNVITPVFSAVFWGVVGFWNMSFLVFVGIPAFLIKKLISLLVSTLKFISCGVGSMFSLMIPGKWEVSVLKVVKILMKLLLMLLKGVGKTLYYLVLVVCCLLAFLNILIFVGVLLMALLMLFYFTIKFVYVNLITVLFNSFLVLVVSLGGAVTDQLSTTCLGKMAVSAMEWIGLVGWQEALSYTTFCLVMFSIPTYFFLNSKFLKICIALLKFLLEKLVNFLEWLVDSFLGSHPNFFKMLKECLNDLLEGMFKFLKYVYKLGLGVLVGIPNYIMNELTPMLFPYSLNCSYWMGLSLGVVFHSTELILQMIISYCLFYLQMHPAHNGFLVGWVLWIVLMGAFNLGSLSSSILGLKMLYLIISSKKSGTMKSFWKNVDSKPQMGLILPKDSLEMLATYKMDKVFSGDKWKTILKVVSVSFLLFTVLTLHLIMTMLNTLL